MSSLLSRRMFLASAPVLSLTPSLLAGEAAPGAVDGQEGVHPGFPSQDPALVRQMVTVCHFSLERAQALLGEQPELAKATWDWGFGDWETALGAASHTGNREIALVLLEHGARMDVFAAAMLGHTRIVRAFVEACPGIQRTRGPHGLTLAHHARAGGDDARETLDYLRTVEGADDAPEGVELDGEARARYLGRYRFAPGEAGVLDVAYSERFGTVTIQRPGAAARGLVHLGEHAFSPVGAPHVRVVFAVEGDGGPARASSLSIAAPRPLVTAVREG